MCELVCLQMRLGREYSVTDVANHFLPVDVNQTMLLEIIFDEESLLTVLAYFRFLVFMYGVEMLLELFPITVPLSTI